MAGASQGVSCTTVQISVLPEFFLFTLLEYKAGRLPPGWKLTLNYSQK
jgi:hypothetical protein